jgi:GNAT superfamily N-acetyltransferase
VGRPQRHADRELIARVPAPAGKSIPTLVTYLEMTGAPTAPPLRPPFPGIEIRVARQPTTAFYRYLYESIGHDWTWIVRQLLSDAELLQIIADPAVEVNVLWVDGVPAGYAELDRRQAPDTELAYFGLMPEFIGRGLGRYLLDWTIHHAWRARPCRLWVHTCDLDHPRALAVYQNCGFELYDQRVEQLELPVGVAWPERASGQGRSP